MSQRSITVGQILEALPKAAQAEIMEVVETPGALTKPDTTSRLKQIMRRHTEALETIGLIPDYAAYAVYYAMTQTSSGK